MSTETFYITKYALTGGILKVQGAVNEKHPSMLEVFSGTGLGHTYYHGEGKDWHRTWEAAEVRAYAMRDAKLESARKQIKRLEKMRFTKPEGEQ